MTLPPLDGPARALMLLTACSLGGCLAEFPAEGTSSAEAGSGDVSVAGDSFTPDFALGGAGGADATRADSALPSADEGMPDLDVSDAETDDMGAPDLDVPDLDLPDLNLPDAEAPDIGLLDAEVADLGPSDLGLDDAQLPDMAPIDAGPADMGLPDADVADMDPPDLDVPDLALPDANIPDAALADAGPQVEACTGLDDDLDGLVDEGRVCGPFIASRCQVILGWSDSDNGPSGDWDGGPADFWSTCPPDARNNDGARRCVATRGQSLFRGMEIGGGMDANDQMGVAFLCDDEDRPDIAAWIQSRCAVYLAHADFNRGPGEGSPTWGPCPEEEEGVGPEGLIRCTSSGYDGRFRPIYLTGVVNQDDRFGVAFICDDLVQPQRAEAVQASAEVFLGWANDDRDVGDNALDRDSFGGCPGELRDNGGDVRCVSSQGDGGFHLFNIGADSVGDRPGFFTRIISIFSIALRAR
ncbi:MAG: hypothetical protein ACE366_13275 [Bradymonadia bacterium]